MVVGMCEGLSSFFMKYSYLFIVFFFFQAEDGIRDGTVTGVQTCALPILVHWAPRASANAIVFIPALVIRPASSSTLSIGVFVGSNGPTQVSPRISNPTCPRSEERRVGKECRSRGSPCL